MVLAAVAAPVAFLGNDRTALMLMDRDLRELHRSASLRADGSSTRGQKTKHDTATQRWIDTVGFPMLAQGRLPDAHDIAMHRDRVLYEAERERLKEQWEQMNTTRHGSPPYMNRVGSCMEANRDAAKGCLGICVRALEDGDVDKAQRFARKSHELFPTSASQKILSDMTHAEANRDAAKQCLIIATRQRNSDNLERALNLTQKSHDLCATVMSKTMLVQLTEEMAAREKSKRQELFRTNLAKLQQSCNDNLARMGKEQQNSLDNLARIQREYDGRMAEIKADGKAREAARNRAARGRAEAEAARNMNNLQLLYEWVDCEATGARILVARRDAAAQARRETVDASFVAGEEFLGDELYDELEALALGTGAAAANSATPNKALDLAMGPSSPTVITASGFRRYIFTSVPEDGASVITASESAPSVATSAITLESTLHLRERKSQRGLTRRELQSTLKHGVAERDPFTGSVLHRHRGITFVTDHTSKVGITAWDEATCKCGLEATCFRGFCDSCCWGCSDHVRCRGARCTEGYYGNQYDDVLCERGFCDGCCHGSRYCRHDECYRY